MPREVTDVHRMSAASRREDDRLAAVRRYEILDTPPDGSFDTITAVAARTFGVPIAIVSVVDRDRIWFKSHHGLDIDEIGRDPGLCASAILQDQPWVVTDASLDPRTLTNPLVAGDFGLRFYAGAPLTMSTGHNLGTLCVIDREPREVTQAEIATLEDLAAIVVNELELRLAARTTVGLEQQLRRQSQQFATALQQIALPATLPQAPGLEIRAEYLPATAAQIGGDWYDAFVVGGSIVAVSVGDVCGHDLASATAMGQIRNAIRAYTYEGHEPDAALRALDPLVQRVAGSRFATVAHFLINTETGAFRAANAGHLPPVLIRGGDCWPIEWPSAPPVGFAGYHLYEPITGVLRTDESLLLYTDGLVERRGESIDDGIDRLTTAIRQSPDGDYFKAALSLIEDRELDDDVAVILVSRRT